MSYDIYLRQSASEPIADIDLPGPTYNLTPIFDRALTGEELPSPDVPEVAVVLFGKKTDRPRGLRMLSGRRAGDTVEWIAKALGHLNDPAQTAAFRALEPDNGWGTLDGARSVMADLLAAAREYPDLTWDIG